MNQGKIEYLVFDVESVPDGRLIKKVKYPTLDIDESEAIDRYREEILASGVSSGFIPVTFQYPVAIVIAKIRTDFIVDEIVCLDEPLFRAREMVRLFWQGIERTYTGATIVTFNGRGFDMPLLELMAYRYGFTAPRYFKEQYSGRHRFSSRNVDLHDWISNFGAMRVHGGLDMLAKVIGKPGKMGTRGDQVYDMFKNGKVREINEYCVHDVLDTYFVFLRTRVLTGELALPREQEIVRETKEFLAKGQEKNPALKLYLDNWGDWSPWP